MHFKHIAIVGVGLIGGSFALAVRRAGIAQRITGWDSKEVLDEARRRGIIDEVEDAFEILSFLRKRGKAFRAGTIVTDAGSTKREICRVARETLPSGVMFVGGHPMAGSHNSGVEHAAAELFQGAPYALVAADQTVSEANGLRAVEEMVQRIGGKPVKLSAEEHDRIIARVSHAPQLLATSIACAVARRRNVADLELAGSGFSEMVRLAASRWPMWEDICRTNADEITIALDELISEIEAARSNIGGGELDGMRSAFEEANDLVRQLGSVQNREA